MHPLFALERGEITEAEFLARLERGFDGGARPPRVAARLRRAADGGARAQPGAVRPLRARSSATAACASRCARTTCASGSRCGGRSCRSTSVFEVVVDSAFVGTRKPEPEIYAITLERLGLPAEACAFVDDLELNVDGRARRGYARHRATATRRRRSPSWSRC